MSKQSSTQQHMYLQQAQQAQREIPQKQFVQQRNAGARQISQQQPQQRLTQPAAMMGTSPGQGYPAYSQYTPYQQPQPGPQFMQGHQMLMQPGAPMQMPNTQVRMSQAGGYGYLQQPQASQYAFAPPSPLQMYYSGAQQPGPGVRQAAMSTVSLPQANYMTQPQQQLFMPAAQQSIMPQKRERKVIPIINPNTGQDVLADDSSKNDSSSTPPMSESSSDRSTPNTSQSTHSAAIEIRPPPSVVTTTVSSLSANADEFRPQANGIAYDTEVSAVDYSGYCDEESAGEMMPDSAEVEAETFEMEDIDEANKIDSLLEPENGPALLVEEEVEFTNITAADKTDVTFVAGILPTSADTEPVANHTGLQSTDEVIETELVPSSLSSAVGDSEEDTCSEVHVAAFAISPSAHPIEPLQNEAETIDALAADIHVEVAEVLQHTSEPLREAVVAVPDEAVVEDIPSVCNATTPSTSEEPAGSGNTLIATRSILPSSSIRPSKSMDSKYGYKEDQWSPLNPEGKKLYDRDFLLTLQYAKQSTEKPEGLPMLTDIILDKPIGSSVPSEIARKTTSKIVAQASDYDFTPGYVKSTASSMRGGPKSSGKNDSRSRGRQVEMAPPRKIIEIKREEIQLHHTDKAWKPLVMKVEDTVELSKTEELYRQFRGILNKLTPQKFASLVAQVLQLAIDTEERLRGTINLVFEKAIDEPNFSVAYANMCKSISSIKVGMADKPGEVVDFRKLLLIRCQREFEKDNIDEEDSKVKLAAIEKATPEAEKKRLQEEYNLFISKARRRSLGNIRFIGELFKLRMLTEAIMHDCIMKLLRGNEEESLECLCRLLTTIGKDLDHEKAKPRNDQYFTQMKKIISQKKTSSRVRFMLQDIIDLRENNWVPRRADNNPKTIEQIHKEAALEAHEKNLMISQSVPSRSSGGGTGGRGGGSGGSRDKQHWSSHERGQHGDQEQGWTSVGSSKTVQNASQIDPSRMKLTKQLVNDDSIQLGPGGAAKHAWGRGSVGVGGIKTSLSLETERPTTPTNRYTALADAESSTRTGRQLSREPAKLSKNPLNLPRGGKLGSRASQEERTSVLAAVKTITREVASRDSSQEPPRSVERFQAKSLSVEEIQKKAQAIHEEYLHDVDTKEAIRCIEELGQQENIHAIVTSMVSSVLERSKQARKQTGQLLHDIVKNGLMTPALYQEGLREVIETADDLAVDVPRIWDYLGELIAPMLQNSVLSIKALKDICGPLRPIHQAGTLVAKILGEVSHTLGHVKLGEMWIESGLTFSDFVNEDDDDAQTFRDVLQGLVGGEDDCSVHPPLSRKTTTETMTTSLEQLIVHKNGSNEDVFDWFEKNLRDDISKEKTFVRALMDCIARSAIELKTGGTYELNDKKLKERAPLLLRFIDHNPELELQALYVLQAVIHKMQHPANILRNVFDLLYDEDIISEEAFVMWSSSDDPSEREGKGVALESTKQFFTWLKNADA